MLRLPRGRLTVAPCGHEHFLKFAGKSASPSVEPTVVMIGTIAKHKNVLPTASILSNAGIAVTIIGSVGSERVFRGSDERLGRAFSARVTIVGGLPDEEVARLLSEASAFVLPSLYEGFGIPVLEAQVMECPVMAAARGALPEVCGDSALLFDPTDAKALVDGVLRLWTDPDLRRRTISKGLFNVQRWRWDDSARTALRALTAV